MRLYDCKVLLAGSRDNEVEKTDVTAAEIMILRNFHGSDSITNIVPKPNEKKDTRSHAEERARLFSTYVGSAENEALGGRTKELASILQGLLGPAYNPLPNELDKDDPFLKEAPEPIKRVSKPPVAGKAEDIAAAAALA